VYTAQTNITNKVSLHGQSKMGDSNIDIDIDIVRVFDSEDEDENSEDVFSERRLNSADPTPIMVLHDHDTEELVPNTHHPGVRRGFLAGCVNWFRGVYRSWKLGKHKRLR
jgi:hypothetical protein